MYISTPAPVKRIILRHLDQPVSLLPHVNGNNTIMHGSDIYDIYFYYGGSLITVYGLVLTCQVRAIGMGSPELLQLVEGCPPGGETLVMRMLHILTESGKYQGDEKNTH